MSNPLFPNHKPEDADLSNIEGYTGHPGQDRVKPDLNSQHEHSAQGYANKKHETENKLQDSQVQENERSKKDFEDAEKLEKDAHKRSDKKR